MALNPAFATHPSRKLPLAFGYVLGSGDAVFNTTASDGSQYLTNILGEGEWDGPEMQAIYKGQHMNNGFAGEKTTETFNNPTNFAFHTGQWSTKGLGNAATSAAVYGQNLDQWFPQYPTVTPPQALSGMTYTAYKLPGTTYALGPTPESVYGTLVGVGIWRTTRCRMFDDLGNVVAYGFTCNPAWHIVEAILRYKIKPQQPPIAGLNAAERACFNWPSIVTFAARNDYILPNGNPRFFFSGIFAADTTLANIIETILRCSRAYMRVTNGQIYLIGDDQRDTVFTLSANHLVPGTLKLSKKDVSQLPNQFVARYRSIDMPAVAEVTTATYGNTNGDSQYALHLVSPTPSPFLAGDIVTYGGAVDASFDGSYRVAEPDSGSPNYTLNYIPNETYIDYGIAETSGSTTGGYLGTNDARFAEYAPATVNHRSHQKLIAQQAPGLSPQPKIKPVYYDMANSTFDQVNRIMKFERDSSLGPDTGVTWIAPISGTLTCYLDAVDSAGNRIANVERHDVITLDDWISPEFAGLYVVKNRTVRAPSNGVLATVDLEIVTYYSDAYTDVSDPPGDYYLTVPGTGFQLTGFTPVPNPAWALIATTVGVLGSGGTWTITIPNLVMQLGGVAGTTAYPGFTVAGVPNGSPCVLYVNDSAGNGVGATFGFVAGTSLPSPAAGQYIVLVGTFTNVIPAGVTPGDPSVLFEPA